MRVAPATTCAFVTIAPSERMMNPEPRPAAARCPERPPKNCSKTSAGTCSITSVLTGTTEGATRATASGIGVRLEELRFADDAWAVAPCAADGELDAP